MKHYYTTGLLVLLTAGGIRTALAQQAPKDSLTEVQIVSRHYLNQNTERAIGYGSQLAWRVTGALSTVSGDDLQKNFTTNLANTLFGRLPGLTVQQNGGEPGSDSPSILSRGIGTFNAGRNVLVIVYGFESSYEH